MDTWVHQTQIRKTSPVSLSNTLDRKLLTWIPHLDLIKGGALTLGSSSTHQPVIRPSSACIMDRKVTSSQLCPLLQLSTIPLLDLTH
jgi:hypothetical protein